MRKNRCAAARHAKRGTHCQPPVVCVERSHRKRVKRGGRAVRLARRRLRAAAVIHAAGVAVGVRPLLAGGRVGPLHRSLGWRAARQLQRRAQVASRHAVAVAIVVVVLRRVRRCVRLRANSLHAHQQGAELALQLQCCGRGARRGGSRALRALRRRRHAVSDARERAQARAQLRQLRSGGLGRQLVRRVRCVQLTPQPLNLVVARIQRGLALHCLRAHLVQLSVQRPTHAATIG